VANEPDEATRRLPATPRLLSRVRAHMRARQLSPRTEQSYTAWIIRYVRYHHMRHPCKLGEADIVAFLTYLAAEKGVARSTQMQALSALMLLYREVLGIEIGDIRNVLRSFAPTRLPAVLSRAEVRLLLEHLHGTTQLVALLLYGSGLRLMECLTLRVKDIDFDQGEIRLRRGKGGKDRVTMLPTAARGALLTQLQRVRALHERDLEQGAGHVALPTALERKAPDWATQLAWQWVFPARGAIETRPRDANAGITSTKPRCSVQCRRQFALQESPSAPPATRCVIRSRRICSRMATTFARFRSCLATRMSAQQ
jgi:integron integrase